MLGYALMANPHTSEKVLKAAGYLAGLGQADIRQLEDMRIPAWAVAGIGFTVGVGAGIWLARRLPAEWIVGKRQRMR